MGNTPPNTFMPRKLIPLKAERNSEEKTLPELILDDKNV